MREARYSCRRVSEDSRRALRLGHFLPGVAGVAGVPVGVTDADVGEDVSIVAAEERVDEEEEGTRGVEE